MSGNQDRPHPRPMLGKKHSEESKQKMRHARQARILDPEQEIKRIAALKRAVTGKPKTQEHRDKISQGMIAHIEKNGMSLVCRSTLGERKIAEYLEECGLKYETQFLLRGHFFDLYVPELNLIIEFDGAHHWDVPWFEPDKTKHVELLAKQQHIDAKNTLSAIEEGYQIVRIFGRNQPGDSHHGSLEDQLHGFVPERSK